MRFIGLDPGASGGIAVLPDQTFQLPTVFKMPETMEATYELLDTLTRGVTVSIAIEAVTPMPKQGSSSGWKFGKHYGFLLGVLTSMKARGIPYQTIRPQVWQSILGVEKRGVKSQTEHKNALKVMAQGLFPGLKLTLATCDALLIAESLRRMNKQEEPVI